VKNVEVKLGKDGPSTLVNINTGLVKSTSFLIPNYMNIDYVEEALKTHH